MDFLYMEPDDFIQHVNSESPMTIDKVTVGAAIIRQDKPNPQILLLEKNLSSLASQNQYELPTGAVKEKHFLIIDAVLSMIIDKTLLPIHDITAALPTYSYVSEKSYNDVLGVPFRVVKRRVMQLSYVVLVDSGFDDVVLDKEVHCRSVWADYDYSKQLNMTEQMRELVKEALKFVGVKVEEEEEETEDEDVREDGGQDQGQDQNMALEGPNSPGKARL